MPNAPDMTRVEALKIKHALPQAVVLDPLPASLGARFGGSGAVWLCAEPSFLTQSGDGSPDWQARSGEFTAVHAEPNIGNSRLGMLAGISGLAFQPKVNCGYCIAQALSGDAPFSIAVIYAPSPDNEPRSLATVNPIETDNYLFLNERDDAVELTDKDGRFTLRQPVMPDVKGFRLAVFSRSNADYALAVNGHDVRRKVMPVEGPEASGVSDVFIGCRSHRKGILKTLGQMLLADVFLWPQKDILALDSDGLDAVVSPEYALLLKYYKEVICRGV